MQNISESDVDGMLRDFFRREVPHPWPPPRLPVQDSQPKSRRRNALGHSYVSLAASVGFLLIGLGLASQMLRTESGPNPAQDARPGTARKPGTYQKPNISPENPSTPPAPNEKERRPFSSPLSSALPR